MTILSTNNNANNYGIATPGNLLFAQKDLTSTNIKNLTTTPISIVSSPGANKMIQAKFTSFILFFNSTPYAGAGNMQIIWTTSAVVSNGTITAAAVTGSDSSIFQIETGQNNGASTSFANNGVSVKNTASAFTTGDSTGRILFWYTIVDLV